MTTSDADKLAYCSCMDQVTRRLRILEALYSGRVTTGDAAADGEFACLQLRKAVEQVAFAALAASRAAYARKRPQFASDWSAKRILAQVEALHPDFYPLPLIPQQLGPGRWHFDVRADGFLTRDDFMFLYDACSGAIHDWNPFRDGPRVVDLRRPIAEWADRIEELLACHRIRLLDQADILVVELRDPSGRARVLTASPQNG
jgi:hypothetical protein